MKSALVALSLTHTFVLTAAFKTPKSPPAFQGKPKVLGLNVRGGVNLNTGGRKELWFLDDEGREQEQWIEKKMLLKMQNQSVMEDGEAISR